jgi:hypothetical protein
MKPINKILVFALFAIAFAGCKKSFLDRPSNSQISSNNFYQSTADLRLATASLYGGAQWFTFQKESLLPLGDILSGNATFPWSGDIVQLYTRTITAQNPIISNGWSGLYNVVAQCNTVISAIQKAGPSISTADKNAAMAEARFIRAVAYYHLAVYWSAVPIIEDNAKLLANPLLSRNITSDVYKFVTNDLTYAAQNLPKTDQTGRVTTWSAQGMLGKVYLTLVKAAACVTRLCLTVPKNMQVTCVKTAVCRCCLAITTFSKRNLMTTPNHCSRFNGRRV